MSAVVKLRKVGTSLGVILDKHVVNHLKAREGDELYIHETKDGISISPYDPDFHETMEAFERSHRRHRDAYRELANR